VLPLSFREHVLSEAPRPSVFVGRYSIKKLLAYSGMLSPEPPISSGKSFSFGKPSFIRSTVS
jgi:hypothetical protein